MVRLELNKTQLKVGWVLTGDRSLASSRLQGFKVSDYLVQRGYDSRILVEQFGQYEKKYSAAFFRVAHKTLIQKMDIVFFQKPGWMMFKLSEVLRLRGVKTIAIQCDPFPGDYARFFDATILTTAELRHQLAVPSAYIIDDMLEVPAEIQKQSYVQRAERLRIVWVGQGTGPGGRKYIQPFIESLSRHPRLAGTVEFVTVSRGDWATRQWSLGTVNDDILSCDVAIIPLPEEAWTNAKSANRLAMFMALGMPTIASPIPSYMRILQHEINSLSARTVDEFAEAIVKCKDENVRSKLGLAGKTLTREHFAPEILVPKWIKVIEDVRMAPTARFSANASTRCLSRLIQITTIL